jgi:hypothetical protein
MPASLLLSHAMEQAIALGFDDNSAHTPVVWCATAHSSVTRLTTRNWLTPSLEISTGKASVYKSSPLVEPCNPLPDRDAESTKTTIALLSRR